METSETGQALPFTQLVEASIETVTCVRESEDRYRLLIRGWLVYFMGPLQRIYFGTPGSPLVEAKRYAREDIALHFGDYEDALLSGFEVELPLPSAPKPPISIYSRLLLMNNLSIVAAFDGPTEIPVFDKTSGRNEPPLRLEEAKPTLEQLSRSSDELRSLDLKAFLASGRCIRFDAVERPKVSVILPVRTSAARTYAAVDAIHAAGRKQTELILITPVGAPANDMLLERIEGVTAVAAHDDDADLARSYRDAAARARGEYLLFLSDETAPTIGSLDAALHVFESQQRTGAVTARLISPDGCASEAGSILWHDARITAYGQGALAGSPDVMFARQVECASAAFLLTPRRIFESFGGFDLSFSPNGYGAADYCLRLSDGGYRIMYEPSATAFLTRPHSPPDQAAAEKQVSERKLFQSKYAGYLSSKPEYDPQRSAGARHARLSPWRLLVVCTSKMMDRKLRTMLETLVVEGCHVSLISLWSVGEAGNPLPAPTGVEVFDGCDPMFLRTLIESRPKYYTAIWIPREQSISQLRELQQAAPSLFEDILVLADGSVVAPGFSEFSGDEADALIAEEYLPQSIRDKLRAIE